jgi:hypothetical protein
LGCWCESDLNENCYRGGTSVRLIEWVAVEHI